MMFRRILIANRGEIACRVMATARRMGIATVAIYSDADADALHVRMADEAHAIGAAPARDSYLRIDAILDVARATGAEAIHPGYGFLSENAEFAQRCADAGVVFIGPPAAAIHAMGSKAEAKTLMQAAGVPLVPGYHGTDQAPLVLQEAAARIGYPVLLKASAGGGGRGMRVVRSAAEFDEALQRAQAEARASFNDDHMLVEKYLTHPRHIEVQVFGDSHGTIVSLFERDCSIQRRHQKVLEESPGPCISPEQRAALGEAAIAAARAVGYVGAGTVEFIHEDDRFYFMEMNTRLQVEHPVTECITGLDLVEWQLRVAAGEKLPTIPAAPSGHAIEARICAEDPAHDFRPATGRIQHLRLPPAAMARVDTGVRQGDSVTPYYDSMIAKLIVHGASRAEAVRRLAQALDACEIVGLHTNLDLLRAIAASPGFVAGDFDTGYIADHPALLDAPPPSRACWVAAALATLPEAQPALDPWDQRDGWRIAGRAAASVLLRHDGCDQAIDMEVKAGGWRVTLPDGTVHAATDDSGLCIDGVRTAHTVLRRGDAITVIMHGRNTEFTLVDPGVPPDDTDQVPRLVAATPGRIVAVFVTQGTVVRKGDRLLSLESMKVETVFTAPHDGTIAAIHVQPGEMVQDGAELVSFAAPA